MDYRANVTITTSQPITTELLEHVAERGGTATGHVGDTRLATTFTIEDAKSIRHACERTEHDLEQLGEIIAMDIMTVDEADRRLAEPAFPPLVGVTEIADYLGVTRQRASALQTRGGFPAPIAVLASGPVWRLDDLSRFAETWDRTPGRPRREPATS